MPASKLSSVMNERTLEFALVPMVQAGLKEHFGQAVPIYFWKSREGNRHSLAIHGDRPVRLLALFGRRPKMTAVHASIEGKLNHQLLRFAKQAHQLGIASIAGFSPVTALFDLAKHPTMYWILLWQVKQDDGWEDVFFRLAPTNSGGKLIDTNGLQLPVVSTADISLAVHETSNVMSFATAVEAMSQLRSALSGDGGVPWWGSNYKPVYFLIPSGKLSDFV
jgi:hypothetical protein